MIKFVYTLLYLAVALALQPVPTRTIMDILSSSPEFSDLVELLQQHELVPLLNDCWNSTLLAPSNSAFAGIDKQSISRDQLLYHLINATAYSSQFAKSTQIYYTYLDNGSAPISLDLVGGVNNAADFNELDLRASPQRGLVHSISALLDIPLTMSKQLYLDQHLAHFASFLEDEQSLRGLTVFAPRSDAIETWLGNASDSTTKSSEEHQNSVKPLLQYLNSPFGKHDRAKLLRRHVYAGVLNPGQSESQEIALADGTSVTVFENLTLAGPAFSAGAASQIRVARNGLFVELDGMLAPSATEFLALTPEKFIMGLGGYSLVHAVSSYGYRSLIDGSQPTDKELTIIVPVGDRIGGGLGASIKPSRVFPAAQADPNSIILYQFLDGTLPQSDDSCLLDTLMPLKSGSSSQKVHFERLKSGSITLNWEVLGSDVYHFGNTSFYTSEELLTAPPSLTMALGPLLISSFSLSFLDKLNRLRLPQSTSWTIFVPTRDAWEKNLLLKEYLDEDIDALTAVFDNLILRSPFYSDSAAVVAEQYNGVETHVSYDAALREFVLENKDLHSRLAVESTNALFDNGVAHVVNTIPLPHGLEITTSDLINAGGRSYFLDLLRAAGMQDVLEPAANFTILVPPPKDLQRNNYTVNTDPKKLQAMLKLHLIPRNRIDDMLDGEFTNTLAGERLEVHAVGPFGKFWGLIPESASGRPMVLLYETGYTNGEVSAGSSVMFIDRHISPAWIGPVKSALRKKTYVILGILFGLVLGNGLVFGLIWVVSRNRDVVPDEEDVEPLYRDEEGTSDDESAEPENRAAL